MTQPIPKSIALVDFSHMLVVNFKGRANDSGPNDAGQATIDQLMAIKQTVDRVVVCLDKKPYHRTLLYPDYKKGRVREPELVNIWSWTMERLAAYGFQMAHAPGEEADDVCATLAREYAALGCTDVRIVTQDKDVSQCITQNVTVYAPIMGKRGEFEIRDTNWLQAKYEVSPGNFALLLAIMGDTGDNIPGIKGLGQKIGAKLINNYHTLGGMAEACVRAVEAAKIDGKLPDFWKKYADGMAQLPTWLKLTTLNDRALLNKTPRELLEVLPQQNLVQEDTGLSDANELDEAEALAELDRDLSASEMPADEPWRDDAAPTAEELAAEAAAMTDATGAPAMVNDKLHRERVADHIQESDPKLRRDRAAALALADQVISKPPIIGTDPGAGVALKKLAADNIALDKAAVQNAADLRQKRATALAPKAATIAASPEPSGETLSNVVPPTQGPAKPPRQGDEIKTDALVRAPVPAPSWALAAQPQTANEMLSVAKVLFNSKFYAQFGSERGVFSVMSLGRELGMGYAESLESFHIVKDRPFPKAKWILARMQAHPDCEWCVITEADDTKATIKMKHRRFPEVLALTYTIEMAVQAGHTTGPNKHNWEKNRRSMLRARAISGGCGDWLPGAVFALHSAEEMADHE